MKNNIIILSLFLLFLLNCCNAENNLNNKNAGPLTRGLMQVEVIENSGQGLDKIKTIRFIVFTDLLSVPKVDTNEFYDESDFDETQFPDESAASKVKIVLEVSRRVNGPNNKLVIAIVNEPAAMSGALNAIRSYADLSNLELDMSHFVANDHLSLNPNTAMPMSGAVWTDQVHTTVAEAENAQNAIPLVLERTLAKVEVYLIRGSDMANSVNIVSGTSITLDSTYSKSYFIHHSNNGHVFGKLQTVSSDAFIQKSWTLPAGEEAIFGVEPICTFYTPERNSITDKLKLTFNVVTSEGVRGSGTVVMDSGINEDQQEYALNVIRRNSVYKIIATIGANGITSIVQDWNTEDVNTEL